VTAQKFRKRPIDVEAVQWTGDNLADVQKFTDLQFAELADEQKRGGPMTAEVFDKLHATWVKLRTGDWILKGTQGEFYPCAKAVFESTYLPSDGEEFRTNAEILGMYRRNLLAQHIPDDTADDLVRDAGCRMHEAGRLYVAAP
jgi:hypothetical protein